MVGTYIDQLHKDFEAVMFSKTCKVHLPDFKMFTPEVL